MNWKAHYAEELRIPEVRERLLIALSQTDDDDEIDQLLGRRAILSFPHTAIAYSGPLLARVVAGLLRCRIRRVLALGVLHGSGVASIQTALDPHEDALRRDAAFHEVRGGILPASAVQETPFGRLTTIQPPKSPNAIVRMDSQHHLRNEFSLDTFFAVFRLAADAMGFVPPEILPVYIGLVRHPLVGGFTAARELARWIDQAWGEETAIVATGDVVHYGEIYGTLLRDVPPVELTHHFRVQVAETLTTALTDEAWETAYRMSRDRLRSDQREMLPVLSAILGAGASAKILSFSLSDYAPIFDTAPPCLVASALIAYIHRSTCIEPRDGEESEDA